MREHTTNNILVSIPSSLLATYDACVLVSAQTVLLMLIMPRTYMEAQAEGRPFRAIVVIILSWILHSTGSQLSGPETAVPTTKVGWADTGMAHHQLMERQRLVGGADEGQTPHFQLNPKLRLPSALGQIPTSAPSGIAGSMSHFASDCLPSLCNSQQPVLEISCLTSYVYLNLREN